jgi:HEAT repeats
MRWSFILVPFLALSLFADEATPSSVAGLVLQADESALAEPLTAALRSQAPLVRATAARVIAVRGVSQLLPLVREALAAETDTTVAREEIRALTLLGGEDDLAFAVETSARWPQGMDNALAIAGARRGSAPAIETYLAFLRKTRMSNHAESFAWRCGATSRLWHLQGRESSVPSTSRDGAGFWQRWPTRNWP